MISNTEPFIWIDRDAQLREWIPRLIAQPVVAFDTESNSMHAYFERVCVIQLSIPGHDLLVDALSVDVSPLGELLEQPTIEKVFHGADYDVVCLKRAFGFTIRGLYDTVIGARVLGWTPYGLASLLEQHFGHRSDKRFQRYDWGRRPLSIEALTYARFDTHFLLELRDLQVEQLQRAARVDEFRHACERLARTEPRPKVFSPEDFWRIKGAPDLDPTAGAILRALHVYRDELARASDKPPFRVISDAVMVSLARARPETFTELSSIEGVPRPMLRGGGAALLQRIAQGARDRPPVRPSVQRMPRDVSRRYDKLRAWRKDIATQRGVEPDIILGKHTLLAIARAAPSDGAALAGIEELDAWERERYGEGLLATLGEP